MPGRLDGHAIEAALGLITEFLKKDQVLKLYQNRPSRYEDIIQNAHRRRRHIHNVARNFKAWADGEPMGIGANMSLRAYL